MTFWITRVMGESLVATDERSRRRIRNGQCLETKESGV